MLIIRKLVFLYLVLFLFFQIFIITSIISPAVTDNTVKFVYIADLNLYPTPSITKAEKHILEKKYGMLIYESQSIFQEIIRYINQKFDFDLIVFGGNNISFIFPKTDDFKQNIWELFLDMVSEIKANALLVFGENEINSQNSNDLIKALNSFGLKTKYTWWSQKLKDKLLIGLDSSIFYSSNKYLARKQLDYLKETLLKNKDNLSVIFLHKSFLNSDGNINQNYYANEFFEILRNNPQVKLVISANEYLNRIKSIGSSIYLLSSSPIAYPCGFKYIELSTSKLKIQTVNIPLKGIIKKSEGSLVESEIAMSLFPNNPSLIKKYVLGNKSDSSLEFNY